MTPSDYWESIEQSHWRDFQGREHAVRNTYLATVERAHREYLTGPFPDRDAYTVVERDAWSTYYAAGRESWKLYRAAMEATAARRLQPPPEHDPYPMPARGPDHGKFFTPGPTFTSTPDGDR